MSFRNWMMATAAAVAALAPVATAAQSSGGFSFGQPLSSAGLNAAFTTKLDFNGGNLSATTLKLGGFGLYFGGTTSSFPALKRTGSAIEVRLADDSAYTPINALTFAAEPGGGFASANSGFFSWAGRSVIRSPADGTIELLNSAETGFSFLQFGGTTASFPALQGSGSGLIATLADNSAYTSIRMASSVYGAGSKVSDTADGAIRLSNSAVNDFARLQFGGTTSSFPALKRNGAGIDVRVADDSAYGVVNALTFASQPGGGLSASAGGYHSWAGRSVIRSPADGAIELLNSAETGFSFLQFGGTTASFPALTANGVGLKATLADNSAFTSFRAASTAYVFGSVITDLADGTFRLAKSNGSQPTVALLPTCNSSNDGGRAFVTDATSSTFAASLAGSGSNHVPVYCDGGSSTWRVG